MQSPAQFGFGAFDFVHATKLNQSAHFCCILHFAISWDCISNNDFSSTLEFKMNLEKYRHCSIFNRNSLMYFGEGGRAFINFRSLTCLQLKICEPVGCFTTLIIITNMLLCDGRVKNLSSCLATAPLKLYLHTEVLLLN